MNEAPSTDDAPLRLGRLRAASALYAAELDRDPAIALWLEEPRNLREPFRFRAFLDTWTEFLPEAARTDEASRLGALRRWRRLMSMRIAYRSVNGLADEPATVEELTLLAEFCIRECLLVAGRRLEAAHGKPRDEASGRDARFCVLALGKLGGRELNFSSDVDLIYLYEGEGSCHGESPAPMTSAEYFTRLAEAVTRSLNERTQDGFLFRADVRLRPEGAVGPLVRSVEELENYYFTAGQTWERLAMIKARPVAGDLEIGAELLENLHAFRYPRHPPPSLLAEVAAMKARSDAEIVGAASSAQDVKLGTGGIREIEFTAQSLQLLHAGRFPFLQTGSTADALALLSRYGIMDPHDATQLAESYWFLRKVEHRLQIRDEQQTHSLPRDPVELASIARSLDFAGTAEFTAALDLRRAHVHALYASLFADRGVDAEFEDWWTFLTTKRVPPSVSERITRWFGGDPAAADELRVFACGGRNVMVTRELVVRFQHVASAFDGFLQELARPLTTLARLGRFAERYGTRRQFLEFCAGNAKLFRVFALLCDRSEAVVDLLCAHPEIVEEVLRPEILRRRRGSRQLDADMGAAAKRDGFSEWLWLYVRSEQVRHAIGGMLGDLTAEQIEAANTALAEAALRLLVRNRRVAVVALGKFGGAELGFGSDLDLIFVAADGKEAEGGPAVDAVRRALGSDGPLGPAFALDMRLRPHGNAGPAVTSVAALDAYHKPGGGGQVWERQALVRARVVAGPAAIAAAFRSWRDSLVYSHPISDADALEIAAMRARVEVELGSGPAGYAFKAGAGGLVDIEFLAQALQMRFGSADPSLREPGTRQSLRALTAAGRLGSADVETLLDNYAFLRKLETALRMDANRGVKTLPADPGLLAALAKWTGFANTQALMAEHLSRMAVNRSLYRRAMPGVVG